MDIAKALAELREQRDDIDHAILSLERLANSRPRGRGRPRGSTSQADKKRSAPSTDGNIERRKTGSE